MSSLDHLLDTMDALADEFNNTSSIELRLKAQLNLVQMDLDIERQVSRNHEFMLHQYEQRVHELDDRLEAKDKEIEILREEIEQMRHKNLELIEKVERQKRKRKMEQWLCETIEEYEALATAREEEEFENERKRLRETYGCLDR